EDFWLLQDSSGQREARGGAAPVLFHAKADGVWYLTPRLDALKRVIDRAVSRRIGKEPAKDVEIVPINGLLDLAPAALVQGRDAFRSFLEWESHRRALDNLPVWQLLYRCRLASEEEPEEARRAARHYLGFVPVSPDGTASRYDPKTQEVVNTR